MDIIVNVKNVVKKIERKNKGLLKLLEILGKPSTFKETEL